MRRQLAIAVILTVIALPVHAQLQEQTLKLKPAVKCKPFNNSRASHQCIISGDFIYIIGGYSWSGNSGEVYDDVQFAQTGPAGVTGDWKPTAKLNKKRSGLAAVALKDRIIVVGGSDENWNYLGTTEVAKVAADGTLSDWNASTISLNISRSNHSLVAHQTQAGKSFVIAVGGVTQVGSATIHLSSVEYAEVKQDGSLDQWKLAPFPMKGGRSTPAALVRQGRLYIFGGWGDLLFDDVFSDVQLCPLDDGDGLVLPWSTVPSELRMRVYGHTTNMITARQGDFFVLVGGSAGEGNVLPFIEYSQLQSDGLLQPWIMSRTRLPAARWGHASAVHGSRIYVTGGSGEDSTFHDDVLFFEPVE